MSCWRRAGMATWPSSKRFCSKRPRRVLFIGNIPVPWKVVICMHKLARKKKIPIYISMRFNKLWNLSAKYFHNQLWCLKFFTLHCLGSVNKLIRANYLEKFFRVFFVQGFLNGRRDSNAFLVALINSSSMPNWIQLPQIFQVIQFWNLCRFKNTFFGHISYLYDNFICKHCDGCLQNVYLNNFQVSDNFHAF